MAIPTNIKRCLPEKHFSKMQADQTSIYADY